MNDTQSAGAVTGNQIARVLATVITQVRDFRVAIGKAKQVGLLTTGAADGASTALARVLAELEQKQNEYGGSSAV